MMKASALESPESFRRARALAPESVLALARELAPGSASEPATASVGLARAFGPAWESACGGEGSARELERASSPASLAETRPESALAACGVESDWAPPASMARARESAPPP